MRVQLWYLSTVHLALAGRYILSSNLNWTPQWCCNVYSIAMPGWHDDDWSALRYLGTVHLDVPIQRKRLSELHWVRWRELGETWNCRVTIWGHGHQSKPALVSSMALDWNVMWAQNQHLVILSNHPHTSGWSGTEQTALGHIGHSDTDHHSGRSSNQKSEPSTFTVQSILWPNVNDGRLSAILVTFLFKNMWNLEQWLADHWYGLVKTRT